MKKVEFTPARYDRWIGSMVEDFDEYLKADDLFATDLVEISRTDEDTYYFYRFDTTPEKGSIEVYHNEDGYIYDITVARY